MVRRSGLGKGLGSLIPADSALGAAVSFEGSYLTDLQLDSISPNPHQPRVHFDEESLIELSASIAQIGVLQPILVRQVGDAFELIAGERRWRAARRAGLAVIPAIVRTTDDSASIEQALVENLHREDLTPLEEAAAYQQLVEDFGMTHEQVAVRVGKSRSAITNTLRLLGLPPVVQRLLADGRLSAGHARALLATPDRVFQEQLAKIAADEGWTVRGVEEAVRRGSIHPAESQISEPEPEDFGGPDDGRGPRGGGQIDGAGISPRTRLRPPGLLELEELLAAHLATRVGVNMSAKRGRVTIEFADLEDLERIYRKIIADPDDEI